MSSGSARPQSNKAARLRLDDDCRHRHSVSVVDEPQCVTIEIDDRHAERLDRRLAVAIQRVDEGARLNSRAGHASRAEQLELQPVEQHAPADALSIITMRPVRHRDDRDFGMVDQVLADARQIDAAVDPMRLQLSSGADARQHQELRRHQRAGGDDHFAIRRGAALRAGGVAVGHAYRAAVLDIDALHLAMKPNSQVGIAFERSDEGISGAAALAAPVHELIEADAALMGAVEVLVVGLAERLNALHEPAREIVDMAGVGDEQRTVGAMALVEQPVVSLHVAKVRQHIRPSPAGIVVLSPQQNLPLLIVGGPAAHIDLRVHRRAAAQDVALRDIVRAPVQVLLRNGLVVAHEFAAVDHLEDAGRHVQQGMAVRVTGLEQENASARLFDEPRRGDAAGRAAADNDMIEGFRHGARSTLLVI